LAVATIQTLVPEDLHTDAYRQPALDGQFDLVIFDRCAPAKVEDMPQANTLFLDQVPPPWVKSKASEKGKVAGDGVRLMVSQPSPSMVRVINLKNVRVAEVYPFNSRTNLPEGAQVGRVPEPNALIETANNVPVLFTLPRGSYTDLVLAVPLVDEKG